ncbi:carbohydrate ABC transporter permease [Dictyobacter kobayashii]|uniref:Sugar ABC transporter permease n=1 Tax=Dictyobacter kobayashii TaxID=2014872 RepID=A0A402AS39_9CHLR|nr:carbohydrate ABC transporter permease [Dictyobacter kobayashii]GCE21914.1 sugar ABC transporter permease [Dictyobacter kobayashii]
MSTQVIDKKSVETDEMMRYRRRATLQRVMQTTGPRVFLILMCLIYIIPFYWMLSTSLKSTTDLAQFPPSLFPTSLHFENFALAVSTIPFGVYFSNTLLITVLTIIGSVLANLVVAYGFACIEWPGRDKVFYIVLATMFIPFPIAIVPQFDLFARLHWINTILPLVVPHFFAGAFFIFMLRQFLLQIPKELIEASRMDGATELQIMWNVVLPLARPALAAVALFSGIGAWNDFMGPLIYLQDDTKRTLAVGLQVFRSTHDIQFNLLMAASLLTVLPLIILFLFSQRFFIKGVTVGSIK